MREREKERGQKLKKSEKNNKKYESIMCGDQNINT